ncbi:MAG: carboxypeptidase-like regulatory domain-containing protein [Butyricimonas faecalis]
MKGTALGFATNMKGEFSFDLPKRDTLELIFSFVGYKQRLCL